MQRELSYTELKNGCSADDFSFRSTALYSSSRSWNLWKASLVRTEPSKPLILGSM